MFVTVTLGSVVYAVIWEIAKGLGGRAASEFLFKRIKNKFQKKRKKSLEQTNLNEADLELVRRILQEELGAFGVKSAEVDMLLINSLKKLSTEHDRILDKLENVESLLMKLVAGLMYEIQLNGSTVPPQVTEELVKQFLVGNEISTTKIYEYKTEGLYSNMITEKLTKYKKFNKLYTAEKIIITRFVNKFLEHKDQVKQLALLAELWAIIAAEDLDTSKILCGIILSLIKRPKHAYNLQNLLKFLYLLDATGKLDELDKDTKEQISSFIIKRIETKPYFTQLELAYFLMKLNVTKNTRIMEIVEKALSELQRQKYSDRFVKESASVSTKIILFFKKLGTTKVKMERTIKVLSSLTKRLERRKFKRNTQLLEGQLVRTLSEINILAANVEIADAEQLRIIKEIVQNLIELLLKASREKISDNNRLLIWKIIDNAVFIINKIAILNTKRVLENWEVELAKLSGFYSSELGEYKLSSEEELKELIKNFRISEAFVKKAEEEWKRELIKNLPEPPIKTKENEEVKE
ncbi:MAG: hypothetical protein DRI86_11815 [Bacteroidetes bacterium]|nr:MAG: hypothetical protein DRI86_11815 [Bacteroidota bacterium]